MPWSRGQDTRTRKGAGHNARTQDAEVTPWGEIGGGALRGTRVVCHGGKSRWGVLGPKGVTSRGRGGVTPHCKEGAQQGIHGGGVMREGRE